MKEILGIIHKTIYQFLDICGDDEEVPMSDKDKLLLEVNKAICNNLKELEKEPCEDCVSIQDVLAAMQKNHRSGGRDIDGDYIEGDYSECLYDDIISLPPVNSQPKTGHWIEEIDDYGEVIGWHCDKCYEDSGFTTDCKWNHCPNCGTKMVE